MGRFEFDQERIIELFTAPRQTPEQVLERFRELIRLLEPHPSLAVFPRTYEIITKEFVRNLDGSSISRFRNRRWVTSLVVEFADLYLSSLAAFLLNDLAPDAPSQYCPPAWEFAFESAVAGQNYVVQDLLLGINAHVNRDLAHTVLNVVGRMGEDWEFSALRDDYEEINKVLEESTGKIKSLINDLSGGWTSIVDWVLGDWDERMTASGFQAFRGAAWVAAMALYAAKADVKCHTHVKMVIDDNAQLTVESVVGPVEYKRLVEAQRRRMAAAQMRVQKAFAEPGPAKTVRRPDKKNAWISNISGRSVNLPGTFQVRRVNWRVAATEGAKHVDGWIRTVADVGGEDDKARRTTTAQDDSPGAKGAPVPSPPSWYLPLAQTFFKRMTEKKEDPTSPKWVLWRWLTSCSLSELLNTHSTGGREIGDGPQCWWLARQIEIDRSAFVGQSVAILLAAWTAYTLPVLSWEHRSRLPEGEQRLTDDDLMKLLCSAIDFIMEVPSLQKKLFNREIDAGGRLSDQIQMLQSCFRGLAERLAKPYWSPFVNRPTGDHGIKVLVDALVTQPQERKWQLVQLDGQAVAVILDVIDWNLPPPNSPN